MPRRFSLNVVVGAVATLLAAGSGCGSIIGYAGPQPINLHLNPDDPADIYMDGIKVGEKSGVYMISPTANSHSFKVQTADGRSGQGSVIREVTPLVVIADAILLVFPILIDYFDGGLYHWPSDLVINMGKPLDVQPQPTDTFMKPNGTDTSTTNPVQPKMEPCKVCGEPRPVGADVCPHCGMK